MFELEGISKFLNIFQKLFGLIEKHREKKRLLLTDVVEPIYTELSAIVGEYYNFFRGCRDEFTKADFASFEEILSQRKMAREEIVLARNKVLGITEPFLRNQHDTLKKSDKEIDKLLYKFADAIMSFFYSSDDMGRSGASSLFRFIDSCLKKCDPSSKAIIIAQIEESLKTMEWKWHRISATYGDIRVYCLAR